MSTPKIDSQFIVITAVVSLIATLAIVFALRIVHPGMIISYGGTCLFIYIGVFTANLIIEAARRRIGRKRR